VPPKYQKDPNPGEIITTPETLQQYHSLYRGTCIISPRQEEAFCKVQFFPFKTMSDNLKLGWERLVCHFLNRSNYVQECKVNGPHKAGVMFPDGWRKSTTGGEWFGRYCCRKKLRNMMALAHYNPQDEEDDLRAANDFIAIQLNLLAPGVFEAYRQDLIQNQLPSMAHVEYPSPYSPHDFASFLTFTMYDFYNTPHMDGDHNKWTLVCWIPVFHPLNSPEDTPIMADEGFDMVGGQFTFRDFQVYIDLNHEVGVTMCVFRSTDHKHQTLPGNSPSGQYTRIGFSCQMSEKMTKAVTNYLNNKTEVRVIAGQKVQIENAQS
jgi:hypothetical protein